MRSIGPLIVFMLAQADAVGDWLDRYHTGESLLNNGKIGEALQELKIAVREVETSNAARTPLGAVLDALGRAEFRAGLYRDAQQHFERLSELWDERSDARAVALANAGQASLAIGDYVRAEKYLREALDIMPGRAAVWRRLGAVLYLRHRHAEAETAERKALALSDPDITPVVWNDMAVMLRAQHRSQEAQKMLASAVSATPAGLIRATMLNNLGMIEWELGSRQEGEAHIRQALTEMETQVGTRHPSLCAILEAYSMMLHKNRNKRRANEIARRAKDLRLLFPTQTISDYATVDWRDLK